MSEQFNPPAPNLEERVARLEQLAIGQHEQIGLLITVVKDLRRSQNALIDALKFLTGVKR